VEVVSTTQPTGTYPSQEMMRQIIGIFDEYTSKENGNNVMRAMKKNAAQGFWNGATPPLGYRLCDAEQHGDPAMTTAPLGIKSLCSWLNCNGYRTKKGGTVGIASVGPILRNTVYIGRWKFSEFDSKTREYKPANDVVEIAVPAIIDQALLDRVAARLTEHAPRFNPPRIVNMPTLPIGLALCAHCGGNMMLRTGTSSTGRLYTSSTTRRRRLCAKSSSPPTVLPIPSRPSPNAARRAAPPSASGWLGYRARSRPNPRCLIDSTTRSRLGSWT
jgi:hypothetical protein